MRSFLFSKEKLNEIYQSKRIVVYSPCSGAGVSFVSEIIATGLSKKGSTALIELGSPKFYDSLGFETRFLERGFFDYFDAVRKGEKLSLKGNIFKDINWIVRQSMDFESLSPNECYKLFYAPKEEYCIYDCSALSKDLAYDLLLEADFPIVVIDPLPSRLSISRDFLEKVRLNLGNAVLLVNKMNNGVHVSELIHFLGTKSFFSLFSVPTEYIYKAEYNSLPISCLKEASQSLAKAQDMLSKIFQ